MRFTKIERKEVLGEVVNLDVIVLSPGFIADEYDKWITVAARNQSVGSKSVLAASMVRRLARAADQANALGTILETESISRHHYDHIAYNTRLICARVALAKILRSTVLAEPDQKIFPGGAPVEHTSINGIIDPAQERDHDWAYGLIIPVNAFVSDLLPENGNPPERGETWYSIDDEGLYALVRRPADVSGALRTELTYSVGSEEAAQIALAPETSVRIIPYLSLASMALSDNVSLNWHS
jgi:hypothetical protein